MNHRFTRIAVLCLVAFFTLVLALPLTRGQSPFDWGLDLSGGVQVTYRPDPTSRSERFADLSDQDLLALAKETLGSRLARTLGVVPDVVVRDDGRLVVSVPGDDDQRRALAKVGRTYRLTLRLVEGPHAAAPGHDLTTFHGREVTLAPARFSGDMFDVRHLRVLPPTSDSASLELASARVAFRFAPPHDAAFEAFTRDNVGREMAIVLDDQVEWIGVIESAIAGEGTLAGGYTVEEASEIADMLRAGTLPIALEVESLSAVGPSLGQALRASGWQALAASILGLAMLLTFAYVHRGRLLLAGAGSLICLFLFTGGLVSLFDLTIDLAAIAGLILSVGMGLDAMILVFEALETDRRAYPAGARRALGPTVRRIYGLASEGGTLLHANLTTLVVVLLLLPSERLSSFAVFIAVGIFASALNIVATRHLLGGSELISSRRIPQPFAFLRGKRPRLFRWRWVYVALLAALLAVPFGGWMLDAGPRLALGADFAPGIQVVFQSTDPARLETVLADLTEHFPGQRIRHQQLGDPGDGRFIATLARDMAGPAAASHSTGRRMSEVETLTQVFGEAGIELESTHAIDARVAGKRFFQSAWSLGLSFVCLGLYLVFLEHPIDLLLGRRQRPTPLAVRAITFAGVALAVVADLAVVLAALALLHLPIDLPIVAALLTIIGYSVNDSVVLASHARREAEARPGAAPHEVVTAAVDKILSRAVLTSLSTMLPAFAILAAGLEPLRGFAWVILIGTAAGTLSSLFVVGSFVARGLRVAARQRAATVPKPALAGTT